MKKSKPAVLDNYRLCFPIYSDYWGGGIADVVYDPGKYVSGALFDLSPAELHVLDAKVGRQLDPEANEIGIYKRIEVKVAPLTRGEAITAITYTGTNPEKNHIPPTKHYMDLLIQACYTHGLSMMWIAYLQSFDTQVGRPPRGK